MPGSSLKDSIADAVQGVRERIEVSAHRAGRNAAEVRLIAVSKTYDLTYVAAACEAGLRHFGENRVEEGIPKIEQARSLLPVDVTWHFIGHIQSRKSSAVASGFDVVHSVDRPKIAHRLSAHAVDFGKTIDCFLEVNLSGEQSKYGFDLSAFDGSRASAAQFCDETAPLLGLPGLNWLGIMTMAPYSPEQETTRPVYRRARRLQDVLREEFPTEQWAEMSMGMSGDFEVAIEEGATMVRIGTAIFGERNY